MATAYAVDAVIKAAREIVDKSELSPRAFAVAAGLAAGVLRTMNAKDWNPTSRVLRAIEMYARDPKRAASAAALRQEKKAKAKKNAADRARRAKTKKAAKTNPAAAPKGRPVSTEARMRKRERDRARRAGKREAAARSPAPEPMKAGPAVMPQ